MTSKRDDQEARVEELLADAFEAKGELLPTSAASARKAEEEGVEYEGELPESLRELRPRGEAPPAAGPVTTRDPRVVSLADERGRRNPWLTHALAAAVGAAAAAVLLVGKKPEAGPGGAVPTGEPAAPRMDAAAPAPEAIALPPVLGCGAGCCAGERCSAAKAELSSCSSGRKCISCSASDLAASRYRLRLGAFAPTEAGARAQRAAGPGGLELCVRVGSGEPACVPAHAKADEAELWSMLPLVANAQDLLTGFVLEVRPRAAGAAPIGEWRSPVQINPTVLCRGLSLKPKTPKDEALGVVSVFLEDAHWVELGRAASVAELSELRKRFTLADVGAKLFETRAAGARKFSLVLGPVDKPSAERLRWAVLEKGQEARLSVGEDHQGEPKALP